MSRTVELIEAMPPEWKRIWGGGAVGGGTVEGGGAGGCQALLRGPPQRLAALGIGAGQGRQDCHPAPGRGDCRQLRPACLSPQYGRPGVIAAAHWRRGAARQC